MNLDEIRKVLNNMFEKPTYEKKRHIVFWYDEEAGFTEYIDELNLENARIIKLTENNFFYVRYEIEKVDTESNILIYTNMNKPTPKENWLLDIYKYSMEFSTEKTVVIMRDFNVNDVSLIKLFKEYSKFFENKERYKTLKSYNIKEFTEETMHIAIMSAICKLSISNFEELLRVLFKDLLENKKNYYESIEKFGNIDAFWDIVNKRYGYDLDRKLDKLMIFMCLTYTSDVLDTDIDRSWTNYISKRKTDCIVFINQFMKNSEYIDVFDELSSKVEKSIKINEFVSKLDIEKYIRCDTFRYFDESIIKNLVEMIESDANEFENYLSIIRHRQPLHFYKDYKNHYEAIKNAIDMFKVKDSLEYGIREQSPLDMINKYYKDDVNGYYLIDKAYRKFYVAFDALDSKDLLINLKDKVERTYNNWYLDEISVKWSKSLSDNLNGEWRIPGLLPQKMFYSNFVEANTQRTFIIISDALRYESARELTDILNSERKGSCSITAMLGSIPSITKLGMASLLPNKNISIKDNDIFVDGISSEGTKNRDKILKSKNSESLAVRYDDIKDLSSTDFRSLFTGKKVVYIYHNTIDATGDDPLKERNVFDAVETTLKEISLLVSQLIDRSSATNIYITSDHGFLYKREILESSDKISINTENSHGRRYAFSETKDSQVGVLTFSMDYILGNNSNKFINVPRGEIRFAKQGAGANYVHGGASLQEVVIPVITFKNSRNQGKNIENKVDVELQTTTKKITTNEPYITFFQKDRVDEKKLPRTLKVYLEDELGNKVSSEVVVIADSTLSDAENRLYKLKITLKSVEYDRKSSYYLVMMDDDIEYAREEFIIDILIRDDFGF